MENDGIDEISSDLIENQSDVQQHAVDAEKAQIEKEKKDYEGLTDRFGKSFDPNVHVVGQDGKPSLTKLNKLKCKPGRNGSASIVSKRTDKEQVNSVADKGNPREAAIALVNSIEALGTMLANEEWAFIKNDEYGVDERARGYDVFEEYFKAKDIGDFPPGVAVAVWAIAYVLPRFRMPKTQSKMQRFSNWIKAKILMRRNKKQPKDKGGETPENKA